MIVLRIFTTTPETWLGDEHYYKMIFLSLFFNFIVTNADFTEPIETKMKPLNHTLNARRILGGHEVGETRPYMVYLRPVILPTEPLKSDSNWLCGGVIIHERYILTSAACIEDAKQFYVVSGTYRWIPPAVTDDDCVNYGAKKAVWKCVPKSYVFDGAEFDNIRWMVKDIAVVKVEADFNFNRRVRGCEFIPKKIAFNNVSEDLERPRMTASIAGWGSTDSFGDVIGRSTINSPLLLEADVVLMSKKNCKSRWDSRYHHIIDDSMICAKDAFDSEAMSALCSENEVSCKELVTDDEEDELQSRRVPDPKSLVIHRAGHYTDTRKTGAKSSGGFCENDHGGPLIVGQGNSAVVVGIISACLTRDLSHKCYGPFLYTSVWKNRHLISCAIDKEMGTTCKRLLRSKMTEMVETTLTWDTADPGSPKKG